jgi:phospho-N-acetylmuramoyl-pentapeptide-transferase
MLTRLAHSWPPVLGWLTVFVVGAVVAVPVILWLIAWQRRRALGQQIYEDGPSSHAVKQGTPTMGGLAFVAAAIVGLFWVVFPRFAEAPLLLLVLAAAAIGFADDYLKLVHQRALGLRARIKFTLLLVVACAFVAWEWMTDVSGHHVGDILRGQIWFGEWLTLPAWLWAILAVAAIVGAANAVNLTDGLDGLAAGACLPPLLLLFVVGNSAIGLSVAGACAAFLFFNRHPARIFMGDTGSLALGALLGGLAVTSHALLLLPLAGVVFVAEALSVILQVASFKLTGKRILKMSPLHHHFEMSGWTETRVTTTFIAASLFASIAVYVGLLPSMPWLWPFARGSAL